MIRALRFSIPLLFATVLMAGGMSMVSSPAYADDPDRSGGHAHDPTNVWNIARGGQPGVSRVALAALGIENTVDILAYCQTLPTK